MSALPGRPLFCGLLLSLPIVAQCPGGYNQPNPSPGGAAVGGPGIAAPSAGSPAGPSAPNPAGPAAPAPGAPS